MMDPRGGDGEPQLTTIVIMLQINKIQAKPLQITISHIKSNCLLWERAAQLGQPNRKVIQLSNVRRPVLQHTHEREMREQGTYSRH